MTRKRLWPAVLLAWGLAGSVLCFALWSTIARLQFPDADDAMRLVQVRDWLGGQSWWDVAQHRLNGGFYPMHWSRLVDLPLAAAMLVFDPLVGDALSTRIALTIVPMLTLLAAIAATACLARRLTDAETARLAMLLAPLSIPLLYQLRPLRIDHHGWQIVLAVTAVAMLLGPPTWRRGAWTGVALATLVTISMEGSPIAAVVAAVAALAWAVEPQRRGFLVALIGSFFAAALGYHVGTRGPGLFAAACDAMSPAWLAVLAVAAVTMTGATVIGPASRATRVALLVACGAASAVTLGIAAPGCLAGPFASLDPLVRTVWYENVSEGLPIWQQSAAWAVITIALPLVGLTGSLRALRASDGEARMRWLMLLGVLVPAILLACLVNRAGATANALALPGAASLLLAMLTRARAIPALLPRVAATAGALMVASPGLSAGAAMAIVTARTPTAPAMATVDRSGRRACDTFDQIRALGRLPAATVFLPLDLTPDLIATTGHHAISGGYHRNAAAMHRVLAVFTGTPETAERLIRDSGAAYVAGCPSLNETELYKKVAPNGFWARLERGERIAWLEPVRLAGSPVLAWRVLGSSRKALSPGPSAH